jgi:chemotaxis protein CheC
MFTEFEQDELREIVNIGSGNASTALAKMLKQKIHASVPLILFDEVQNILPKLGLADSRVTVVLVRVDGEIPGVFFIALPLENGLELASMLTGEEKSGTLLNEFGSSALKEVGNILSGASLTALSKFLGLDFVQSVPEITSDMLGAILESILVETGEAYEKILLISTNLDFATDCHARLFFVFNPDATNGILSAVQRKLEK